MQVSQINVNLLKVLLCLFAGLLGIYNMAIHINHIQGERTTVPNIFLLPLFFFKWQLIFQNNSVQIQVRKFV